MPLVYADDQEAAQVVGNGWSRPYAEAMAGVGRADVADREMFAHASARLANARGRLVQLPQDRRPHFGDRVARMENLRASIAADIAQAKVIGPRREERIRNFFHRVRDLSRDIRRVLGLSRQRGERRIHRAEVLERRAVKLRASNVGDIFHSLGLKDPLSKYEAKGMTPMQIFARFRSIHVQANQRIAGIPRGSVQDTLKKQSRGMEKLRTALEPVFASGARMGTRDRDTLKSYVLGVQALRSAVNKQVKVYGLRAIPDEEVVPAPAKPEPKPKEEGGGFPLPLLLIPLIAVAAG